MVRFKKNQLEIKSIVTKNLNRYTIKKIILLKILFWKYSNSDHYKWFIEKVKNSDMHNLLLYKKKLIGYNLLRFRSFKIKKKIKHYLYFDTLIIHPEFRNLNYSDFLLSFNNKVFKKKKLHSLLLCHKNHEKFYNRYNWKKISNSKFIIKDHYVKKKLIGMVNNFDNNLLKYKKKYFLNS